jgi:hypothetical protein
VISNIWNALSSPPLNTNSSAREQGSHVRVAPETANVPRFRTPVGGEIRHFVGLQSWVMSATVLRTLTSGFLPSQVQRTK